MRGAAGTHERERLDTTTRQALVVFRSTLSKSACKINTLQGKTPRAAQSAAAALIEAANSVLSTCTGESIAAKGMYSVFSKTALWRNFAEQCQAQATCRMVKDDGSAASGYPATAVCTRARSCCTAR